MKDIATNFSRLGLRVIKTDVQTLSSDRSICKLAHHDWPPAAASFSERRRACAIIVSGEIDSGPHLTPAQHDSQTTTSTRSQQARPIASRKHLDALNLLSLQLPMSSFRLLRLAARPRYAVAAARSTTAPAPLASRYMRSFQSSARQLSGAHQEETFEEFTARYGETNAGF